MPAIVSKTIGGDGLSRRGRHRGVCGDAPHAASTEKRSNPFVEPGRVARLDDDRTKNRFCQLLKEFTDDVTLERQTRRQLHQDCAELQPGNKLNGVVTRNDPERLMLL